VTEPAAWDSGGISPEAYLKSLGGQSAAVPPSQADEGMTPDEYVAAKTAPSRRAEAKPAEEKSLLGRIGEGAYNAATAVTGGAPPEQRGVTADSFWPVRVVKGLARSIHSAATAPQDVWEGRLDPNSPEGIGRAMDVAGVATALPRGGRYGGPNPGGTGSNSTARTFVRQQLPDFVDDAAITKATSLLDDAKARGITLTWPEALSQVTGKPVLTDMQRVLEGAKQTRAKMQEVLGDRPAEVEGAARNEIANIAPPTPQPSTIGPAVGAAAEDELGRTRKIINNSSEPYYDRAKTFRLTESEMNQVRALPGYQAAAKEVRGDPQLNRHVGHLPEDSIGFLNEVKKVLDQQSENASSPVQQGRSVQRAAGLGQDAQAVRDAAMASEAKVGEGNYAQALNIQEQGRKRFLDPLLQGPLGKLADRNIATKNAIDALFPAEPVAGTQHEVGKAVGALARQNETAARQLVAAHIESKLNEAFDAAGRGQDAAGFAGAGMAQRLTGNPLVGTQRGHNFRAAVEALPNGKSIWPGVERFLEIARATGTRQAIGSKTAFNEAELHGMGTGKRLGAAASLAASPGEWLHMAHDLWAKWQTGRNLDQLAKIITDRRSEAIFRSLGQQSTASQNAIKTAAKLTALRATEILGLPRKSPSDK
jgi:hypothetical protein